MCYLSNSEEKEADKLIPLLDTSKYKYYNYLKTYKLLFLKLKITF